MNLSVQTLNMLIGSDVQLSLDAVKNEAYHAKFLGYADDESLMFSAPDASNEPLIVNIGDEFVVRFNDGEKKLAFRSEVLAVCEKPYGYIHVSFPAGVQGVMLRSAPRYPIAPKQKSGLQLSINDGQKKIKVQMTDVSQLGACLAADSQLGKIDDKFFIDIVFGHRQVTLPCQIRYLRKEKQASGAKRDECEYIHGVKFDSLGVDAQLFVDQFIQKHLQEQYITH